MYIHYLKPCPDRCASCHSIMFDNNVVYVLLGSNVVFVVFNDSIACVLF